MPCSPLGFCPGWSLCLELLCHRKSNGVIVFPSRDRLLLKDPWLPPSDWASLPVGPEPSAQVPGAEPSGCAGPPVPPGLPWLSSGAGSGVLDSLTPRVFVTT